MYKVLIIEDEQNMREELCLFLKSNGYDPIISTDFLNLVESEFYLNADIILMDVNLPDVNGQFLCREIRKKSSIPIIMVTSKNSDLDELISINCGADDYITKPYNPQILLARIERILSRINNSNNLLTYKNINIDISKSIVYEKEKIVELSRNEIKILLFLLKNKGTIVSRDKIINYLWDNDEYVDDNTLTVNINRLRSKLSEFNLEKSIETRRGQGYIII